MPAPCTPVETHVYALMVAAAESGARAPKNWEIAAVVGCAVNSASAIVGRLEARGWIAVERGAVSRVVTIVASGQRTAGAVSEPHWRLREDAAQEATAKGRRRRIARSTGTVLTPVPGLRTPEPVVEPGLVHTDRDPCFRCGARGDVACGHRRAA